MVLLRAVYSIVYGETSKHLLQVLSPHGIYFPGTSERLVSAEGKERSVFLVVDWIIDRMHDLARAKSFGTEEKSLHLKKYGKARSIALEPESGGPAPSGAAAPTPGGMGSASSVASSPCSAPLTCKLCVPRAVVGSLIGRQGGYIQSVRVATEANINISPLFVTADEACAERIITIESTRLQSLRTATFTLVRKINSHPEKATCKHMCYYRKFSFEPSPLALIEENRRERGGFRLAASALRTTTAGSQSRLISAENETCTSSAESLERLISLPSSNNHPFNHHQEPLLGAKPVKGLTRNPTMEALYGHSMPTEDVITERDVSCFSAASTATSATKVSSPFDPFLPQSSLSTIGSTKRLEIGKLSGEALTDVKSANGSSLNSGRICDGFRRELLASSLPTGFFTNACLETTGEGEDVEHVVPSAAATRSHSMVRWTDLPDTKYGPYARQEKEAQGGQSDLSASNVHGRHHILGCSTTPDMGELARLVSLQAEPNEADMETEKNLGCSGSRMEDPATLDYSDIPCIQLHRDQESRNVAVQERPRNSMCKVHVEDHTSCTPGLFAEEHTPGLTPDEPHYIPYTLSRENLSTVCSTAAGSIATLTTILQGIQTVPNQEPNMGGREAASSESAGPSSADSALQEASAVGLQLCKSRQFEQQDINAPEKRAGDELLSFIALEVKNIMRETGIVAAAAQFTSVIQDSVVMGGPGSVSRCMTTRHRTGVGLDPAAAEFFPSNLTSGYPYTQMLKDQGSHNATAVPPAEETAGIPQKYSRAQSGGDMLHQGVNITVVTDATCVEDEAINQTPENKGPLSTNSQCLFEPTCVNLTRSPAVLHIKSDIVSAVAGVPEGKTEENEPSSVATVTGQAASAEQYQQTPLPKIHASVEELKSIAGEKQLACNDSGTACTAIQEAIQPVKMPNMPSASAPRFADLAAITGFATWIPNLFDCSLPTFMALWAAAVIGGLLLSFIVAYARSP